MTFPAWYDLHADDEVASNPTASRVYSYLLRDPKIFFEPQNVKAWLLAAKLRTRKSSVIAAINLLVSRGYLVEHARAENNVRRVTVAIHRLPPPSGSIPK